MVILWTSREELVQLSEVVTRDLCLTCAILLFTMASFFPGNLLSIWQPMTFRVSPTPVVASPKLELNNHSLSEGTILSQFPTPVQPQYIPKVWEQMILYLEEACGCIPTV